MLSLPRPLPQAGGELKWGAELIPLPLAGGARGGQVQSMKPPTFRPRDTDRARALRSVLSPAERKLWASLSRRQLDGFHFTKQFQIGPYFADFACRRARLVVELDGYSHNARLEQDAAKDRLLQDEGYTVLRFRNEDVMENLEGVLLTVRDALVSELPLAAAHSPSPDPSRLREGRN